MMNGRMALVSAMLLASCGGAGPGTGQGGNVQAPGAPATPDPVEVKLRALNPIQQRVAFYRAILDGDYTCKKIVSVVEKPRNEGRPVWLVTCDDQGEYVITLVPGGTFTVTGVPQPKNTFPHIGASPATQ